MNSQEAVMLCRLVAAYCPQQRVDDWTPDAWHDLLGDLRFEDCKEAAANVARKQPFVSPSEIRDEVRVIRDDRIAHAPILTPPPDLDELGYRRWLAETRRRVADGEPVDDLDNLPPRDMSVIEHTFKEIAP